MRKMGFANGWVRLIMESMPLVSYKVKDNDSYTHRFFSHRGLRQGDPLSLYLFILCAEGQSAMLQRAEKERKITGVRICKKAPTVNHQFFADDSLILTKAEVSGAQELTRILEVYEMGSGRMINRDKSSILFNPNTNEIVRNHIRLNMSITQEAWGEKYLGLPVSVGIPKKKTFEYIKKKIWDKIQGWQEKLLSKVGKEILLKAIAQSISTYAMSCFDLTKEFCDDLSTMIGRYWWSQQNKKNKIHWIS